MYKLGNKLQFNKTMLHCCLLPSESEVIHADRDNCYSGKLHPSQHAGQCKYSKAQPKAKPASPGINQLEVHTSQKQTTYSAAWLVSSSGLSENSGLNTGLQHSNV